MIAFGLHVFLRTLLLPPACNLIVGVVGLLCARRRPRLGLALCAVSIVSLWLLSTPIISYALERSTERYPAVDPAHLTADEARAQAIVILAGGLRFNAPEAGGDTPTAITAFRLIEGARIARATGLPVLVTGNHREAFAMRRSLEEDLKVPVRWTESESRNTRENADFTAKMLKPEKIDRILLVTSSTHLVRAVADFKDAGFEISPVPAEMATYDDFGALGVVPSAAALTRSQLAIYEWLGRLAR